MVSRIFFRVLEGEKSFERHADLKQLVGSSFETPGSIEVNPTADYAGPLLDHNAFAAAQSSVSKTR
jgi:hypothetical protein